MAVNPNIIHWVEGSRVEHQYFGCGTILGFHMADDIVMYHVQFDGYNFPYNFPPSLLKFDYEDFLDKINDRMK